MGLNSIRFKGSIPRRAAAVEVRTVYKNIRAGFDGNLRYYLDENVIAPAFHHNALLIVSNGHRARYGSITSQRNARAGPKGTILSGTDNCIPMR